MPLIETTLLQLKRQSTSSPQVDNSSAKSNIYIAVFLAILSFIAVVATVYLIRKLLTSKDIRSKPISRPIPNGPGTSFATLFSTFRPFQARGRSNSDSDIAPGYGGNAGYGSGSGSISSAEEGGAMRSVENVGGTSIRTNMVSIDTSTWKRHFAPTPENGNRNSNGKSVLQRNSTGNSRQYTYSSRTRTPTTASTQQQRNSRLSRQFGAGEYGPQSAIPAVPQIKDYSALYNAAVIKSPVTSTMAISGGNRTLTRRSLPPRPPSMMNGTKTVPVTLFTKIPPTPQSEMQVRGENAGGTELGIGRARPTHSRQGSSSAPADIGILSDVTNAVNETDAAYLRSVSGQERDESIIGVGIGGTVANGRAAAQAKFQSTGYAINSFIDAYMNNEEQNQIYQLQSKSLPQPQVQVQSDSDSETPSRAQSISPPLFQYSEKRSTRVMVAMGATIASGQVQRLPIISEKPQLLQAPTSTSQASKGLSLTDSYGNNYGYGSGVPSANSSVGTFGANGVSSQYAKPPTLPEIRRLTVGGMQLDPIGKVVNASDTNIAAAFPSPPINADTRGISPSNTSSMADGTTTTRQSRPGHLRMSSRKERPVSIIVPSGIIRPDVIISVSPGPGVFIIDE